MKFFFTLLFTSAIVSSVMAADIYVREFGGGAYPTISEAIDASSSGDRILVVPKSGNAAYIENLSINKRIQLLSATNGARFYVQGNVTISTGLLANGHVVIDGMYVTVGNITAGSSTNPISVTIVNTRLGDGRIGLGTNIYATIANCQINNTGTSTSISFTKGKCLGNRVTAENFGIAVANDNTTGTDTTYVVGNNVIISGLATNLRAFSWSNSGQFFYIANNQFRLSTTELQQTPLRTLVSIGSFKAGTNSNEMNNFLNNTIYFAIPAGNNTGTSFVGLSAGTLDNRCNIINNLVRFAANSPTTRAAFDINGNPNIQYNTIGGVTVWNKGTATLSNGSYYSTTTVSTNLNGCVTGTYRNTGHPDPIFTNLDLTRNDVGTCGGSYNIEENFPNMGQAGVPAIVHWLEAPRRVLQGGTVAIKAEGHDR